MTFEDLNEAFILSIHKDPSYDEPTLEWQTKFKMAWIVLLLAVSRSAVVY